MALLSDFTAFIKQEQLFNANDHLLLAVSGGMDSVVLCELCRQAGYNFSIAHANFRLRGEESERDELFVKELAQKYGVPFFVKQFETSLIAKEQKNSIETTARNLRYAWFTELAAEQGIKHLLTAHHADDNIETVLMHFFRGTGIRGLRGMLPAQGMIKRPLLFARQKELEQFVSANQLSFVTDSSNLSSDYTRNYFRNELIPSIARVFPSVEENILHNAYRAKEVETIYHAAVETAIKKLVEYKKEEVHIPVLKLQRMPAHGTILHELLSRYGFTAGQLPDVLSLLDAESGKYVVSATHRVLRNRAWLIISGLEEKQERIVVVHENETSVPFVNGVLQFSRHTIAEGYTPAADAGTAELDASLIAFPLLLRQWKTGDYFYPLGMDKKKKLSRFFIDQKLSLADKEKVWVLESGKKIIWITGMRIDHRFRVKPSTKELLRIRLISQ